MSRLAKGPEGLILRLFNICLAIVLRPNLIGAV